MSQSPKTRAKLHREPPPSLFLGPPSQNASYVSLPGVTAAPNPSNLNPTRAPLIRQRSQRMPPRNATLDGPQESAAGTSLQRPPARGEDSEVRKQADRTDALWAEMQSTLEEVELSVANGTHVFGPAHSKALEELRAAQIGLAQAWARSEADDAVESADRESKALGSKATAGMLGSEGKSVLDTLGTDGVRGSTIASGSGRPGSSGAAAAERMGSKLEEETEADILLARRRREANDKYFQRVNGGVLDVVAKLEEVANAMKAVEQESRDIWGETESDATSFHA